MLRTFRKIEIAGCCRIRTLRNVEPSYSGYAICLDGKSGFRVGLVAAWQGIPSRRFDKSEVLHRTKSRNNSIAGTLPRWHLHQ